MHTIKAQINSIFIFKFIFCKVYFINSSNMSLSKKINKEKCYCFMCSMWEETLEKFHLVYKVQRLGLQRCSVIYRRLKIGMDCKCG